MIKHSTDLAARGRKLRRHAERLGFTASRLAGGGDLWRIRFKGHSAIAGPLDRCERFLADQAAALAGTAAAASPALATLAA